MPVSKIEGARLANVARIKRDHEEFDPRKLLICGMMATHGQTVEHLATARLKREPVAAPDEGGQWWLSTRFLTPETLVALSAKRAAQEGR